MTDSSSPDNRFSKHNDDGKTRLGDSELFAALINNDESFSGELASIPPDLIPLLETTRQLRGLELAAANPVFRTRLRAKLLTHLADAPMPMTFGSFLRGQWQTLTRLQGRARLAAAASMVALIFALSSVGTAYAAQSALPGDTLYNVKLGIESVQLALTPAEGDSDLMLAFLDRRVEEIEALTEQGRYEDVLLAAESLSDQLTTASDLPDSEKLKATSSNAINALTKVLEKAPEQAVPAIEKALEKISKRQGLPTETPSVDATEEPVDPAQNDPGNNPGKKPTEKPKNVPAEKTREKPAVTPGPPVKPPVENPGKP